ncbi:MAG: hypothetical protein KGJ98_13780 [Chloroflexota bacterium]|nr:hypothetical protein [Chloroflexota bacterium]MDE3103293.1 hypothetical protein [Chloroflexota bacterium]
MARLTLIHHFCRNPDHQKPARDPMDDPSANPVTLNGKEWAFCPAGAKRDHQWDRIDGLTLDELRERLRTAHRI